MLKKQRGGMILIGLTSALTLAALYAPQPLLPLLAREFAVTQQKASLLITLVFIPLSIAPLIYGYVLESFSPRRLLRLAILLLAFSEILIFAAGTFNLLLLIRLLQGILIPAILTSMMTYLSAVSSPAGVQRALAIYIACTILGGFLGRALSGLIAAALGWRFAFLILAGGLLLCFFLLGRLGGEKSFRLVRPARADVLHVLSNRLYQRLYVVVFCLFLVFAAIMNFLPFRITELNRGADTSTIGLIYSGYMMGIVTSLGALRLSRLLGGEIRTLVLGMIFFSAALLTLLVTDLRLLFAMIFVFCGAMFLVHTTASGFLNRRATRHKGLVNGLYVSSYYAGGTVGSSLPGFVYTHLGWNSFIFALLLVTLTGIAAGLSILRSRAVSV